MAKKKKTITVKELRLEDILWNCRDILRGKGSLAYKRDIILTLVFLKFAGEKFSSQREKIIKDIQEKNLPIEGFIEMPFSYGQDGIFYLPTSCRWETILKLDSSKIALELDNAVAELDRSEKHIRGALPQKIFTDSKLEGKVLKSLISEIDKISAQRFKEEKDLIGKVYEYFLQAFSINAEKEEGEFYTPHSIVNLIARMIEPYDGSLYDPCCGAGGMFIQAAKVVEEHGGNRTNITVFGQEINPETYRLAKMNLAVRGIAHDLGGNPASTFSEDKHPNLKAQYIMANPPFNLKKWRAEDELLTDIRWGGYQLPPVSNANYAWILHILHHLDVSRGIAGFLLSNGALGDSDTLEIRKKLIENDKIEAIIVLPREMFYSTDISVTLWILNQNKRGGIFQQRNLRDRRDEILFMDLRTWNQNIYEKKFVELSDQQIKEAVKIYHCWQEYGTDGKNYEKSELYKSVQKEEITKNGFSLVPSRYIEFVDRDSELDYEKIMKDSAAKVAELIARQKANECAITKAFEELGYGV